MFNNCMRQGITNRPTSWIWNYFWIGIIACIILLSAFLILVLRGLQRAKDNEEPFCRLSAAGLVILFGAQAAINYREQDFVAEVQKVTGGHGADVILDMAGAAYAKRNLQALAMDGRVMHLSSGDKNEYSVPLSAIMGKRAVVSGSGLRVSELAVKVEIVRQLNERVWPHLGTKVTPVIDSIFPLVKACDAHARMETSEHIGKILLEIKH